MQVANPTTPANYFHVLRRQMLRPFRKPLVLMTPKSLLRHKECVSYLTDFGPENRFHRILDDRARAPTLAARRLVLCSGKVYFDLADARDKAGRDEVYILRVEQLYPFPADAIAEALTLMPHLETVVWAQEEPRNNGAWSFVREPIDELLADRGMRVQYAGRPPSAATATGLAKRHALEQQVLVAAALGEAPEQVANDIGAGAQSRVQAG